ncbi:MAG: hypothetical protein JXA07_10060 [Spirochaetes bacterium]|nr:hypothetical protein [Spirochaetota bacterium]
MKATRNSTGRRAGGVRWGFAAFAMVCALAAGCIKSVREDVREAPEGRLFVTWEFTSVDRDGDPYTQAALVINGKQTHRHVVGVFYGRVRKILKPEEINRQMIGGTISGFVTSNEGRGHEVIVRYNETVHRLIVAERQWSEHLPAGSFGVIKNIPVPDLKKEETGF